MTITNRPPGGHVDLPAADPLNGDIFANGHEPRFPSELLTLAVQHPVAGVCVVAVMGEVDALTAPLLDTCIREQLASDPAHLILDLQPVRFLGSSGLACLLGARELAQQNSGSQLHLAGLVTRAAARPLQITELLGLFNTHPTLTHALAALAS